MSRRTPSMERFLGALRKPAFEVAEDLDTRQRYAKDEGDVAPVLPEAVLRVDSPSQVSQVLAAAQQARLPVTVRAGGSSRVGGATPCDGGVVLLCEGLDRSLDVDTQNRVVVAGAGWVLDELNAQLRREGLFYAPDPNSSAYCRLGGTIGTNAAGPRAYKYGVTREHVLGMRLCLASGEQLSVGRRTRKGVTGYDLCALMVGSEGTLGVVTEATLRVLPLPESERTLLVYLRSLDDVAGRIQGIEAAGLRPRCIELMDCAALEVLAADDVPVPRSAEVALLIEFDGSERAVQQDTERCLDLLSGVVSCEEARDAVGRERLWVVRRELSRSLRRRAAFKLSEDVVVPLSEMASLLRFCSQLGTHPAFEIATYGHAGDGNLHVNLLWQTPDDYPAVELALEQLFREVLRLGGTLSGEHGIGLTKAPFLHFEQSAGLIALQRALKQSFDPQGILNPGKIFGSGHGLC